MPEASKEVANTLLRLLNGGGCIVTTCSDYTSRYIELMKRFVAQYLSRDRKTFKEKQNYLTKVFGPQLKQLRGVSRSTQDWVADQLLNPAFSSVDKLSLMDAIEIFSECEYLGSSPRMFTDYSWYKDIWFDNREDYRKQYEMKSINLMLANMESEMFFEQSRVIEEIAGEQRKLIWDYENAVEINDIIDRLTEGNNLIAELLKGKNDRLDRVLLQITQSLKQLSTISEGFDFSAYPDFFAAFGKTQQYISLIKKV